MLTGRFVVNRSPEAFAEGWMNKSTLAVLAALAAQLLALPGAQAFPDRPIKIAHPFSP